MSTEAITKPLFQTPPRSGVEITVNAPFHREGYGAQVVDAMRVVGMIVRE